VLLHHLLFHRRRPVKAGPAPLWLRIPLYLVAAMAIVLLFVT
jgi:hypothetical protein